MHQYKVAKVAGDNYAAEWTADAFAKAGVRYEKSERDRSGVYADTLPLFTSGRVRLLDNPRMVSQFSALERRTFATGRERIDPGPGHDDLANSAALSLSLAAMKKGPIQISDELLQRSAQPTRFGRGRPCFTPGYLGQPGSFSDRWGRG